MEPLIGIDLGTTNTRAAIAEDGEVSVIRSFTGQATVPSVVAVDKDGNPFVGDRAKRRAVLDPANTISAVKRLIGRRYESPECGRARARATYQVVPASDGGVSVRLRDRTISLQEISALVLTEVKRGAERRLGRGVEKAVITVPAYFTDRQRQATKDAGRIAGLDVLRVLNEPTAAALAFGLVHGEGKRIAIYDLGGGTFDVSILDIAVGVAEVRATGGDSYLGGEDFDEAVVDYVAVGLLGEHGVDVRKNPASRQRLKDAAERAKCELSSAMSATIDIPYLARVGSSVLDLRETLRRTEVEPLVDPLIARTIGICRETLERAELTPEDIDDVVLVGGQTRMPAVRDAVRDFFGRAPSRAVNPDEAVAIGACLYGQRLITGDAGGRGLLLIDAASHSIGVATHVGEMAVVIDKNTPLPARGTKLFTTASEDQTAVTVKVFQGENKNATSNEPLGEVILEGLDHTHGTPQIDVTFEVNADGIARVSARDRTSGQACQARLVPTSGLSESEISEATQRVANYVAQVAPEL